MIELLNQEPWLLVIILIATVIISCVAIVSITSYLRQSQQAEIDASLKQDMLNRGMSAADIKTVLEASSDGEAIRLAQAHESVRVGLGKFHVQVGPDRPPTAESSSA